MATTIKDVAREAGVSIATVSRIINKKPYISDGTTKRVLDVMERLEYTPNARARSFKRKSTKSIAFLTAMDKGEAYANPHMFDILCGAHRALSKKGYSVTLVDVSQDEKPGATAKEVVSTQGYDGMVVHGSAVSPSVAALMARTNFPHIVIGKPGFESQICWLDTNNVLAGDLAARHLADGGSKHIAFIGGKQTERINMDRLQGVRAVVVELGLVMDEHCVVYTDSSVEDSYTKSKALLDGKCRPDAIICENNTIAIGTLKAVRDAGLSMPADLQLIAFDDYPYSRVMDPIPTVVNIDVFELGYQSGALLLKKIRNPALQVQSFTTLPEVIVRSTTLCK